MANTVDKVIAIAEAEVGYLEKRNSSNLDSKTGNAGSNNYTKYWRDVKQSGYQGQPWCQCFVDWCFMKAFGEKTAKKLLHQENGWTFYTPDGANRFKNNNQWHSTPKVGDIIYFKNSSRICHVGIVRAVDNNYVYTYEGNTSSGTAVVANGGGVFKKYYSRSNSRIAGYGRPKYDAGSSKSSSGGSSSNSSGGLNKKVKWTGKITASTLNVRKGAGKNYANLTSYPSLKEGTKVGVCDSQKDSKGTVWYYIKISGSKGDKYGFVSSKYIKKV